jgi:hypothetical protein
MFGPRAKGGPRLAAHTRPMSETPDGVWVPCATCWGQRRVYTASPGGGGLTPHACAACLGLGERLSPGPPAMVDGGAGATPGGIRGAPAS